MNRFALLQQFAKSLCSPSFPIRILLLACLTLSIVPVSEARAEDLTLKNGTIIEGLPVPVKSVNPLANPGQNALVGNPIWMIEDDLRRYFVPSRQVQNINKNLRQTPLEIFELDQEGRGRRKMVQSVGGYVKIEPFTNFGRRTVTLSTAGKPLEIIQGVTHLTPQALTIMGLNYEWELGIATTSVPHDQLRPMLHQAIDMQKPADRMAIVRFYMQAEMYLQATEELDAVRDEFPALADRVDEHITELRKLLGKQLMDEIRFRQSAGQHRLAEKAATVFPKDRLSPAVLRDVQELVDFYKLQRQKIEEVKLHLGDLQAQVQQPELVDQLSLMRDEINEQLNFESLTRLESFLSLSDDENLSAEEKLALAYSGWVLGSQRALDRLDTAMNLWDARRLVLEYLRAINTNEQTSILSQITRVEGIGPERMAQLIENLPPILETPNLKAGEMFQVSATEEGAEIPVNYSVLLPEEYTPHHRYPMIVALRARGQTPERELIWWGGTPTEPAQSQRRGYIVISPEIMDRQAKLYDYGMTAHNILISAIRDARKRFNIDSDRIFLSGHGLGADAAFDFGMSHPDLFAGVIPVVGKIDKICSFYWQNAKELPWYVVGGQLDRNLTDHNARVLDRMMRNGFNLVYAEYIGRGYESYYEEIHRLFAWMELHRRSKSFKEIDKKILRISENRFYWLGVGGFPKKVSQPLVWKNGRANRTRGMTLSASIKDADPNRNTIYINSAAASHTLWLSPDIIDFDKRLTIKVKTQRKFSGFLEPSIADMLDDFRVRGDRQKLTWARIDIN